MLRRLVLICLVGVVLESLWVAIHAVGPLRENTGLFLQIIFAAFALCFWSYIRLPIPDNRTALLVIGFGLLFRLTVLPAPPYQSEDVYRYLWDARISSNGIDPFRYAPDAPELEKLRDTKLYPMLNSKPYITAYPPLSQILFRLCHALFGDRVMPMKTVFGLLEFAALLIAWCLLRVLKQPFEPLYLMAWNPFFIFEFSHSGHSDSGAIMLTLLSILLLHRGRNFFALASHAGAVLSKLHPGLWFPLYLRRAGWKAGLVGISTGVVAALLYFSPAGLVRYLASLRLYYRLFEFNASIHYFLCYAGRIWFQQSWDQLTGPFLLLLLVIITAGICWKFPLQSAADVLHAGFWIMTADLCLSTTVHPWYLSWAALALPVFPYLFMFYWTGAVFLSYLAYQYRPVHEPAWALLVQYLPMYALMALEIYRGGPLLEHRFDRNEP